MFKIEQSVEINEKGQLIVDNQKFKDRLSLLDPGDYTLILEKVRAYETEQDFQRYIGQKIADFTQELGGSRQDRELYRKMIYEAVLPKIYTDPANITIPFSDITDYSTKILTDRGRKELISGMQLWMWSTAGIIM